MGKFSERRKRRQLEYLTKLAATSPEQFQRAWASRLPGRVREARRNTDKLVDGLGKPTPSPFIVVEKAAQELKLIGKKAVKLEGTSTREALSAECTRALRQVTHPRALRRPEADGRRD